MKKFELKKQAVEIKWSDRNNIKAGCSVNNDGDHYSEIVKSFDTKEEALADLQKYTTEITELSNAAGKYYLVEEYYVEENTYDEYGEWESGGDIWEFSKIKIEVVKEPEYETVGVFENMKDAEDCLADLEEGSISF